MLLCALGFGGFDIDCGGVTAPPPPPLLLLLLLAFEPLTAAAVALRTRNPFVAFSSPSTTATRGSLGDRVGAGLDGPFVFAFGEEGEFGNDRIAEQPRHPIWSNRFAAPQRQHLQFSMNVAGNSGLAMSLDLASTGESTSPAIDRETPTEEQWTTCLNPSGVLSIESPFFVTVLLLPSLLLLLRCKISFFVNVAALLRILRLLPPPPPPPLLLFPLLPVLLPLVWWPK